MPWTQFISQLFTTEFSAFRCRFCPQSYKYSVDLNKHLRTHFGNKLHECSKCPKRFKYARQLEEHQSQHYRVEKWANESMKENFHHSAVPSASLEWHQRTSFKFYFPPEQRRECQLEIMWQHLIYTLPLPFQVTPVLLYISIPSSLLSAISALRHTDM